MSDIPGVNSDLIKQFAPPPEHDPGVPGDG